MIDSRILDVMARAGCSAEQIVAVVREHEAANAERLAKCREQNRIRQQNHRSRNALSRVTDRDGALPPVPDKEKSPTPPKEINPSPSPSLRSEQKQRATRLPADFEPDVGWACAETGMSRAQAESVVENFRDYWTAKSGRDATKLDWPATWRNWVRNSRSRGPGSRAPPGLTRAQQHREDVMRNLREAQGIFDDEREFAGSTIDH